MLTINKKIAYVSFVPVPGLKSVSDYCEYLKHSIGHYKYFPDYVKVFSFHCAEFDKEELQGNTLFVFNEKRERILKRIFEIQPDILIIHDLANVRSNRFFKRNLPNARIAYWYHGGKPGIVQRLYLKLNLSKVDSIIIHSKNDLKNLKISESEFANFIEIPEGSTDFECNDVNSKSRAIVWVGRNIAGKNPQQALLLTNRLLEQDKNVIAHFILKTENASEDKKLIKQFEFSKQNSAGRFNYYLNAKPESVKQIMCSSSVYLSLSKSESTGFSLLEAMATGCIPVISRISSHEKIAVELPEVFWLDSEDINRNAEQLCNALNLYKVDAGISIRKYFEKYFSHKHLAEILLDSLIK